MTQKIYKTARGLQVDIGSMRLQNENVRAVGNMGVNARGDRIDPYNNVIDSRNQQLQRRINRQTNVSDGPVHTSSQDPTINQALVPDEQVVETAPAPVVVAPVVVAPTAPVGVDPAIETTESEEVAGGGLAAAMARAKTVKQELEKTQRQKQQATGVRKI